MATSRIDRSDDTAAVLKIIATVADTEDAVTKQWQGVVLADGTAPSANKATVASGALKVDNSAVTQPVSAASLPLPTGASTAAKQPALGTAGTASADVITVQGIASMTPIQVGDNAATLSVDDGAASLTVDGTVSITANSSVNMAQVGGTNVVTGGTAGTQGVGGVQAHDAADFGNNPVKIGVKAIAHGANPTAVSASGDVTDLYANRAGVQFVIGGHPNIITLEAAYTAAQTDIAIITQGAGGKIVVTQIQALTDSANTVAVGLRIGMGAAATPTTTGVVLTHPGLNPGSGVNRGDGSGILAIGADGDDLRITSTVPTGGSLRILVSYYIIDS